MPAVLLMPVPWVWAKAAATGGGAQVEEVWVRHTKRETERGIMASHENGRNRRAGGRAYLELEERLAGSQTLGTGAVTQLPGDGSWE